MTFGCEPGAVILPFLSGSALYALFRRRRMEVCSAILTAAVCWGGLLVLITELLSLFTLLTYWWLVGAWLSALVTICAALCMPARSSESAKGEFLLPFGGSRLQVVGISLIVGTTGLTALVAAPNNYDSLTYHLGRIIHWSQNQSIANYPTHLTRQLYSAPWAEFVLLHLQLLSGGDRLANLVQWVAMIGSLLVVGMIAGVLLKHFAPGVSPQRSILATSRIDQYYANKPEFRASQEKVANRLAERNCTVVGLQVGPDYWEYPLWIQLQRSGIRMPRFEHVAVANRSASLGSFRVDDVCTVLSDTDNMTHLKTETE